MKTPTIARSAVAFLAALVASPAAAEICADYWFTRNAIIDRAGYCFASPLGQAIFDNSDCSGEEVVLSAEDTALIEEIRAWEAAEGCDIDTDATILQLSDVDLRRQMVDIPVRSEFESACIGWRRAAEPLYAGRNDNHEVVSWIEPGDLVLFSHVTVGEWRYVTAGRNDYPYRSAGWTRDPFAPEACKQFAG